MKAAIIGASGYTGGELIRILANHPEVEIAHLFSRSFAGKNIADVHEDLFHVAAAFSDELDTDCDIYFLCMGHGASQGFVQNHAFTTGQIIVDLSHDFRIKGEHDFIYGLPELQRSQIKTQNRIANPGCFATAIQLALLPLAEHRKLTAPIHVHAITGSTGAGKTLRETTHFTWRNNNVSVYKAFQHQHLAEIKQSLHQLQETEIPEIHFVPMRGNFPRGILASIYFPCDLSEIEAQEVFKDFYHDHPFVTIVEGEPNIKQVVNTNHAIIQVKKHGNQLHLISAIDNLVKGASGQAVQNFNLAAGLPEATGLNLKSVGL